MMSHFLSMVFFVLASAICFTMVQVESKDIISLSTFDTCDTNDFFVAQNACSVVENERRLPNWFTVMVNGLKDEEGGFLYFHSESACLTASPKCESDQFTYFGWVKFHQYPECGRTAAYLTSPKFDLHLLASGHLKVTVRTGRSAGEKVAVMVSRLPVLLDEWYALILQVNLSKGHQNDDDVIKLYLNKNDYSDSTRFQLDSMSHRPKNQESADLVFIGATGSDGNNKIDGGAGFTKMELSRAYFADYLVDFDEAWNNLTEEKFLHENCQSYFRFLSTGPFRCYDFAVPKYVRSFSDHESSCSAFGHYYGYYVARPIRMTDRKLWHEFLVPKIGRIAARYNYTFWTSPGQQGLYSENDVYQDMVVYDEERASANDKSSDGYGGDNNCTVLDATVEPWTLRKVSCAEKHALVCEVSWDCLANSPCQNDGLCRQTEDGAVCECLEGTSGEFCQHGTPSGQLVEALICEKEVW